MEKEDYLEKVLAQKGHETKEQIVQSIDGMLSELKTGVLVEKLLKLIMSEESNDLRKKEITSILTKQFIKQQWDSMKEDDQNKLREGILNSIIINSKEKKLVKYLSLCIAEMITKDGLDIWQEPLDEFNQWVQNETEDLSVLSCYLLVYQTIFSNIDFQKHPLYDIVSQKNLMKLLYDLFVKQNDKDVQYRIIKLLLKFIQSIQFLEEFNPIVNQCLNQTYDLWISLFIQLLNSKQNFKIKNVITQIFIIFFRDFPNLSKKQLITVASNYIKFMFQFSQHYIENRDQIEKKCDFNFNNLNQELAFNSIEFLHVIIFKPTFIQKMLQQQNQLIIYLLFQYSILQKTDIMYFNLDSFAFENEEDDENNIYDVRTLVIRIFQEFIEKLGNENINKVLEIINGIIFQDELDINIRQQFKQLNIQPLEMKSSIKWKYVELCLFIINRFSNDIIIYGEKKFIMPILDYVNSKIDAINAPGSKVNNNILFCRIIQTEIKFLDYLLIDQHFEQQKVKTKLQNLQNIMINNSNNQLQIQIMKCLNNYYQKFINYDKMEAELYSINYEILFEVVNQLNKSNFSNIHIILQFIYKLVIIDKNIQQLLVNYIMDHLYYLIQVVKENINIRKSVINILKVYMENETHLQQIIDKFLPYVKSNINQVQSSHPNYSVIVDNALEILDLFIKPHLNDQIKNQIIACIFDQVIAMIQNPTLIQEQHEIVVKLTIVLKNLIFNFQQSIDSKMKSQIYSILLQLSLKETPENCCLYLGNLIILYSHAVLTIYNRQLNNDNLEEEILKNLSQKVFKCRNPSIAQSLVLVFARMINSNKEQAVQFLTQFSVQNRMGMKVLMDRWLIYQPLFRGKFTKNATFMALKNLYELDSSNLEQLLVIGFNPSHSNLNTWTQLPLKILSILIRCLYNEYLQNNVRQNQQEQEENQKFKYIDLPSKQIQNLGQIDEDDNQDDDDIQRDFNFNDAGDDLEDLNSSKNAGNQIQVDLDQIHDDEEYNTFLEETKKGGLGDLESGSECLMSELLDFDFEEADECDDTTEQDLLLLNDQSINIELTQFLVRFFSENQNNSRFKTHLNKLLQDDQQKLAHSLSHFKQVV